jgi:hypothetical protein
MRLGTLLAQGLRGSGITGFKETMRTLTAGKCRLSNSFVAQNF